MNTKSAIAKIHAVKGSWVRVERVHRVRGGLRLALSICKGKGGKVLSEWVLACGGVREARIDDLDGGGLQLWDRGHPVARQYTDPVVRVACIPADHSLALGVLFQAHAATVDDWISFERYLGLDVPAPARVDHLRLKGPRFLMARYVRALRKAGVTCRMTRPLSAPGRRARLGVVHFGNSYVVARTFEMEQGRDPLANEPLPRTANRPSRRRR